MRRRDLISTALALAALLTSVLALGGAMRWAQAIVAILAAGALVPLIWSRTVALRPSPLCVGLGLAASLSALQLVPLPRAVLEALNPTGATLRTEGAELVGVSPWPAITMDAPATLAALAFFLTLLAIAVVATRIATTERGRYRLLAGVAIVAAITAMIVGIHKLVGATELYGLYDPQATPNALGPLLNENHLGGFMAIGAIVAMGLVTHTRQPSWMRVAWLMVVGGCAAVAVATQSRGATLALVVGAFVTIGALAGQRFTGKGGPKHGRLRFMTGSLPIAVVAVCAVVVVIYSSAGGLQRQIDKTTLREIHAPRSKFSAWRSAAIVVQETPWVGVGRRAMESSFTRVHPPSGFVTFSHVENEYIQAVVDWGIPGALLLGAACLWLAASAIRKWRDGPLAAAALGGLAAIAVQSNVDFGIELLGLALPITVIAATVSAVPLQMQPNRLVLGRALRACLAFAVLGGAYLLSTDVTTTLDEDREQISRREKLTLQDLHGSIERHPLDYYGYAKAADLLKRQGDGRAVRFLNHALVLHPRHSGLHRMAALMLSESGRIDQAAIEYALAVRASNEPERQISEIVTLFSTEKAAAAIPADLPDLDTVVRVLKELKRPDVATIWLMRVLDVRPRSVRACELLYALALQLGDLKAAEAAARRCVVMMPDRQSRLSLAQLLFSRESYSEVIALLHDVEDWQGHIDFNVNAWLIVCDAHTRHRNWDGAKRCLRRLSSSGDVKLERRGEITTRLETIEKTMHELTPAPDAPATGSASPPR